MAGLPRRSSEGAKAGNESAARALLFREFRRGYAMSSFGLYVLGFVVLLGGVGYGAWLLHVPHTWIVVGALVIIGIGIMSAVTRTKRRDPPSEAPPP
jgi:hypothetical protein